MHAVDGVFDRHGDILLGDVRRRAGPAVTAVEMDYVGAGVIGADGHHVDVDRRGDLGREQRPGIDVLDPIEVFFVIFDGIDTVEREGREQGGADHGLSHGGHRRRVLTAQQVPTQARLGPLGILELDHRRPLNRLFPHAEQSGGDLRDHVVFVRDQPVEVTALAGAGERVPCLRRPGTPQQDVGAGRAVRHAAAVPWQIDLELRPRIISPVQ